MKKAKLEWEEGVELEEKDVEEDAVEECAEEEGTEEEAEMATPILVRHSEAKRVHPRTRIKIKKKKMNVETPRGAQE